MFFLIKLFNQFVKLVLSFKMKIHLYLKKKAKQKHFHFCLYCILQ